MLSIPLVYLEEHIHEYHARGWKSLCLDCGGHNLYYTSDNGLCHCFNCSVSYKVSGTVIKRDTKPKDIDAIRAYYAELSHFYQGCIDKDIRNYLFKRGINDAAIDEYQIGFCPSSALSLYKHPIAVDAGIATTHGNPSLADRIVLPYLVDMQVSDMRGRATKQDQDPKYKSLFGSSESRGAYYLYNWERAVQKAREKKFMIITEGEIKALVADIYGFPCVALPGMAAWRRGFVPESDWRVITIFDATLDRSAQYLVDRALARIHDHIPTMSVGVLPLLGEAKQDLDSFLLHRKGGQDRLQRIVDTAVSYKEYARLRAF